MTRKRRFLMQNRICWQSAHYTLFYDKRFFAARRKALTTLQRGSRCKTAAAPLHDDNGLIGRPGGPYGSWRNGNDGAKRPHLTVINYSFAIQKVRVFVNIPNLLTFGCPLVEYPQLSIGCFLGQANAFLADDEKKAIGLTPQLLPIP